MLVIEYCGDGDPFFGGDADDRALRTDGKFHKPHQCNKAAIFTTIEQAHEAIKTASIFRRSNSRAGRFATLEMKPKPSAHAAGGFFLANTPPTTPPTPSKTIKKRQLVVLGVCRGFLCAKVQPNAYLFLILQISRTFFIPFLDICAFPNDTPDSTQRQKTGEKNDKKHFFTLAA